MDCIGIEGYPRGVDPDPISGNDNLDYWSHDAGYRAAHHGNLGDRTDVFDGAVYTAFGPDTNPSSASRSGDPTGIWIGNIRFEGGTAVVEVHPAAAKVELEGWRFLDGNGDGDIEAGEPVTVRARVRNVSGTDKRLQGLLRTADPYVVLEDSVADLGEVPWGEARWATVRFSVGEGFWGRHPVRLDLEIRDDAGHVWTDQKEVEFVSPQLPLKELLVLDGGMDGSLEFGNGDGEANPGETIRLEAVAEVPEDLALFRVVLGTTDPWVRAIKSSFLIAADIPEGHRIPFETQVVGSYSTYRDTLYVQVRGSDETPPQVLGFTLDPNVLTPGSATTAIRVPRRGVVEGGSVSRMEARIYALTDSQLVDVVELHEGEEEFRGEWSYGKDGHFFVRILAVDQAGNRMQTRTDPFRGSFVASSESMAEWIAFTTDNSGLPDDDVRSLAVDAQGYLWIGTVGGGLAKFDGFSSWEVYNRGNSGKPSGGVNCLAFDSQGYLWIGTGRWGEGAGLARFDGINRWEVYDTANSPLPSNNVSALAVDLQGNLWIGTWEGLARFDGINRWEVYDTANSPLPSNNVNALAVDLQGNLWVGTREGLARFDGIDRWEVYDESNSGLPPSMVFSLAVDAQGHLWIGSVWCDRCLAKFDGVDRWEVYDMANSGLQNPWVHRLAFDSQGDLWIGTWAGLARFDGVDRWEMYDTANSGLPSNDVWSLAFDSQGHLWIGTSERGLAVHREGGGRLTAVLEQRDSAAVPRMYSLAQNHPNPFNSSTVIRFALPRSGPVELALYNLAGQKVVTLVDGMHPAGTYTVHWDGRDAHGHALASGVYLYRLRTDQDQVETRKLVLLR